MTGNPFSLSVKAIILDAQGRCLLLRRSALNRSFAGNWEWPGGKVEAGEDFVTAIHRETREETALEIEILGLAGATQFAMPTLKVVLLCMEARLCGGELKLSEEHDQSAWVQLSELNLYSLPAQVAEFILAYAQRKGTQP